MPDRLVQIREFVLRLDKELAGPDAGFGSHSFRHHHLEVVLTACGIKRKSRHLLDLLSAELAAKGIYPQPDLTTFGLKNSANITFSRVLPRQHGIIFGEPTQTN